MAPNPSRIAFWTAVPNGSIILISVKGTTATSLVTAHTFLLREDGMDQTFPDSMLQPGPLSIPLNFPHTYSILTDLIYATSGTADLTAQVIAPGNRPIPPDGSANPVFTTSLPGSQGQTVGVSFFIVTIP